MMNLLNRLIVRERGFTLVETLVAISVLMIAIVGPYYIVQQSINASYAARDQLIASSLAQEAAEYVYFVRDNNFLAQPQNLWLSGLDACRTNAPFNHSACIIDPYPPAITNCDNGCSPLQLDPTNLQYRQNAGFTSTRFTRTVQITEDSAHNQARVVVAVNWKTAQHTYTITVTEILYKWL